MKHRTYLIIVLLVTFFSLTSDTTKHTWLENPKGAKIIISDIPLKGNLTLCWKGFNHGPGSAWSQCPVESVVTVLGTTDIQNFR